MKVLFILILFLTISFPIYSKFLRNLANSDYQYTNYNAVKTNEDISEVTLTSKTSDQSVVYITEKGKLINDANIVKESGDSSNTENSEFYGVNAAILVNGGSVIISDGAIETKAKGANALCATNGGEATISGTHITSTAESSGRGLHATYGGKITATRVQVSSTGGSCATLATDRGEGTVTCSNCTLSTNGAGSPLIYSTGDISVTGTTGTSGKAQAVVVEGKNTATVTGNSNLKCNGLGNRGDGTVDQCGVMLYQSMSGDADSGTSSFKCSGSSTIEILSTSSVYSTAPMFFITNTDADISLEGCTFTYGSKIFLKAAGTSEWGTSGSNGGVVTLTLKGQQITGDFVVDSSSGLTIALTDNSKITGSINSAKSAAKLSITLDSTSSIELTGDSAYTSLITENFENLINGTYSWSKTEEQNITRTQRDNQQDKPNGGSDMGERPDGPGGSDMGGRPDGPGGSDMGEPPERPGGSDMGERPEGHPEEGGNNTNSSSLKSDKIKINNIILGLYFLLILV